MNFMVQQLLSTKSWTSSLLAQEIDADVLVILTAVEKVAINFGTEKRTMVRRNLC